MVKESVNSASKLPRGRLFAGTVIFLAGQSAPLAIPLVTMSSLPTGWKTGLSGFLLFGVPEIAILLTIVVLGKAGFDALKSRIFGLVGRTLLPAEVSRPRYYTGLVLFLIPFFIGWVSPYAFEVMSELNKHQLIVAVSGDLMLIFGLCLMGGQFWDKLRALFVYDAEVTFPCATTSSPG